MLKVLIHLQVSMENVIFDVGITGGYTVDILPNRKVSNVKVMLKT